MKLNNITVEQRMDERIIGFLKRVEHEDFYDRNTNFTPFSLRT